MATKILFVDDDREILDGFKRVLFKMRKEWEMDFVTNAEEALVRMNKTIYNAVVSDIGMSGSSGIELFDTLRMNHPGVARIIVSGNSDMKGLIEVLGTAHQFLVKPVNPTELKNTLIRVMSLREYLKDEKLTALVNKIESLPTQPELHTELLHAITTASVKEIAATIKKDLGMMTKILQLVNSPLFGVKKNIGDIQHAITLLGIDILNALVLSLELFSKFTLTGAAQKELKDIFNHSSDVANYARIIAMEITGDKTVAGNSYMGGMLHDIGKLIILSEFTELYFQIKEQANRSKQPVNEIERQWLGVDHSRLGAYLLGLWGIPDILVETTAYHHCPNGYIMADFSPITAVHIADAVKRNESNNGNPLLPGNLKLDYLEKLNVIDKIPLSIEKINKLKSVSLNAN
jgi:HD-like signal output (HDOD) protein